MKEYTGIGSRKTPEDVLKTMMKIFGELITQIIKE